MKRGFTMLLAEDDQNERVLMAHVIALSGQRAGIGINIQVVDDGAEAIAYLSGEGKFRDRAAHPFPELIVLDLKMPRMDGLDVLRWLSEHPEYRRVPKIMLSGSGEDRDVEEAYRLGVNTYFQKPASLDEYRELVHHMILYWSHTKRPVIRHAAA